MTYPYHCEKCGDFTVQRSMKDEPLTRCPQCGEPVKRIYTPTSSIAKCGGFFGKSSRR